jgi:hypothetical protein
MRDGRSTAYLAGLQTRAMRGVHPSLNNVATAVVVVGIVVRIVSVVVPVAIRPVAVVVVPVVVAIKSSNDGTGAKAMEATIVGSSNDGAGAKTVNSSSESATVEAAAKAAHAASVEATATTKAAATKAAAPMSTATSASASASASAATSACLCTRREQRAGKEGGCQYHYRFSSSHESFLSTGRAISDHRTSRPGPHVVARLRIANGKFRRQ